MYIVKYKCRCTDVERLVDVRFRRPDEDILHYMDHAVNPAVGRDHAARSPGCRAEKLTYLKMPVPENAPGIGEKPKLDS